MKKNITKKLILLALSIVFILSTIIFSGCNNKNNKQSVSNSSTTSTTEQPTTQQDEKAPESPKDKKVQNLNIPYFEKVKLDNNFQVKLNTPWKQSLSSKYSVCIEGKGSQAAEEGIGTIIVKNNKGEINSFKLKNAKKQSSPLYLQWGKNDKLMVIIGNGYGTLAKGGSLYVLDVADNINEQVIKPSDSKQMISKVSFNGDKLDLTMFVYNDDNFENGHTERWNVQSFDINLEKTMEVKNAEGKTVYKIN